MMSRGAKDAGRQASSAQELTWRDLADALWLAAVRASAEEPPTPGGRDDDGTSGESGVPPGHTPDEDGAAPRQEDEDSSIPKTPTGLTKEYLHLRLAEAAAVWPEQRLSSSGPAALESAPPARAPSRLRDSTEIARSLRSFKRRVPSGRDSELDEEVTAERAAEDGLWLPYTRPTAARWLELTLVVDEGPSMPAWRRTVAQFTTLLGQLGGFRDVRLRYLDIESDAGEPPGPPRVILRGSRDGAGISDPAELLGPPGRRVILVLTDGLGPAWLTGAAQCTLAMWSQSAAVAVIHLLSQQSWHRTAVNPHRVRLRAPEAAAPNQRYVMDVSASRSVFDPLPDDWSVAVPVPVLELGRDWLAWWARIVTDRDQNWHDALVLLARISPPEHPGPDEAPASLTGREQVLRFRASASPTAVRLATHLAATPLGPDLIEILQRTMLPESGPMHLAEILASGLIQPSGDSMPRFVSMDFIEGAREALLAGATRADTAHAFATAADHYSSRIPVASAMRGALATPDEAPVPPVNPETIPFVRVELEVMKALSGPYLSRARRLGAEVAGFDQRTTTAQRAVACEPEPAAGLISKRTDSQMNEGKAGSGLTTAPAVGTGPESAISVTAAPGGAPAASVSGPAGVRELQEFTPPVWNVPPKNPNFTGREDLLSQLHDRLRGTSTAAVTPNTLHGMGGVGKSQIAIEYVYRHVGDYDIIWWIPAEQQSQILASLAELAQSLKLDVGTEANTAVPAVREALRSGRPYKNWLLVFDNAEDIATVRSYFPTGGAGKILVTSRNLEWSAVADSLSIDVFRREESRELLQRRNPDLSDTDADHLADALGDLPLAIEQAASWRAATGMAVDEYLSLIDQKRTELLDISTAQDYSLSVAAAWNVSLDRLAESSPAALQLLQICAFMAPEPIPRGLFRGSRNVQLTPELDEALADPIKLGRAIRDLNRYALARIDHRNSTIQLHRLVQAALIGRMTQEDQNQMRHYAHLLLANANPNSPGASDQWPRYQALLPHITVSGAIDCDDPWARQLLSGICRFLYYWGDHESCQKLSKEVSEKWLSRFPEEDAETLAIRKFSAFIDRINGNYQEAAAIDEAVLAVYDRIAREDDEGAIDSMLQVSIDMRVRGEFVAARDNNQLVLARARRAFGDDDPATLNAAHSLGVSFRYTGEFQTAFHLDQDTWQRRAIVLGEDDPETIRTLDGLAIDQREIGDYIGARNLQEETYARAARLFRASNPLAIRAARALAVCRRRAGDIQGARALSEETLRRFERRYGENYPDTLATAANLAVDLQQTGDLMASRKLSERTVGLYARTLGEKHPHTLSVRANLAIALRLLGEVDAAYQLNLVTLAGLHERLGDEHPLSLTCAINLGSDYYALQNFDEALRQDAETLDRLRRVHGEDHPTTLACALNKAQDYRAAGRTADGDGLRADTIARFRRVLGNEHPATMAAAKGTRADADIAPLSL